MDSHCVFVSLSNTRNLILFHLFFLLYATIWPRTMILLVYFFYFHTIIRPTYMISFHLYMVLFHLFFLLCTTIRPRTMVLTDLFLLIAHDNSTNLYGPLSFILYFRHDHSTNSYSLHWFISFICTGPFDPNI